VAGLDVERVAVDIRDAEGLAKAADGAERVFHLAALYRFWPRDPALFYQVNVEGTRNLLAAARHAERVVYTSSVATLGLRPGQLSDEDAYADVAHLFGAYKQSKYVAEHEVLRAGAEGLPVSLVLPTFPLGPGDRRPTPTGKLVLDFLNGRMPGYVDTAMNVAHVDDLAAGHVLALEQGRTGRSYILGGENLTLQQVLAELAALTGLPAPYGKVPKSLALAVAAVSELVEGRLLRRHPSVPLEAARMSTSQMSFDISRARAELGYAPRPAVEALEASARWFAASGMVSEGRLSRIHWSSDR
jgi:dihydroflavonol-4-reductase